VSDPAFEKLADWERDLLYPHLAATPSSRTTEKALMVGGPCDGETITMRSPVTFTHYCVPHFAGSLDEGWIMVEYQRSTETGEWLFVGRREK